MSAYPSSAQRLRDVRHLIIIVTIDIRPGWSCAAGSGVVELEMVRRGGLRERNSEVGGKSWASGGRRGREGGGSDVAAGRDARLSQPGAAPAVMVAILALSAVAFAIWQHKGVLGGSQTPSREELGGSRDTGGVGAAMEAAVEVGVGGGWAAETLQVARQAWGRARGARERLEISLADNGSGGEWTRRTSEVFMAYGDALVPLQRHHEALCWHVAVVQAGTVQADAGLLARCDGSSSLSEQQAVVQSMSDLQRALTALGAKGGGQEVLGNVLLAMVAVVVDLQNMWRYNEALQVFQAASSMPWIQEVPGVAAVLLRLESSLLECLGQDVQALQRREAAMGLGASKSPDRVQDLIKQVELLRRVRRGDPPPPQSVQSAMIQRELEVFEGLHKVVGYSVLDQLPGRIIPNLLARPWHDVSTWPSLGEVASTLEEAHPSLVAEYNTLSKLERLDRDTSCIRKHGTGEWRRFSVNGLWNDLDAEGCASRDAPTACGLVHKITELFPAVRVLRAGYSELGPLTWLQPHWGMTNGQLKMHLGLVIPPGECATLRVGNETRAWEEGRTMFFDDSFEHEARNDCDTARSVFQLVFEHPQLRDRAGSPGGAGSIVELLASAHRDH